MAAFSINCDPQSVRTGGAIRVSSLDLIAVQSEISNEVFAAIHGLSAADRGLLYPMIHESNNNDASAVLGIVGEAAIERVAREAGMNDYAPGVGCVKEVEEDAAFQLKSHQTLPGAK